VNLSNNNHSTEEHPMTGTTPYLVFNGNCREAMTFYQSCLGGELSIMTFGESGQKTAPEAKDRVMHARLANGATVLMASDNMPDMEYQLGDNVWTCLECDSDEQVDKLYAILNAGGKDSMAPSDTFWGAYFAMLTDRFGFHWMLNHGKPNQG
jgi:PhnB protein